LLDIDDPKEALMAIDTTKVENRRRLHFDSLDDILRDLDQLNRGKVQALGNWSAGQILNHLSIVMVDSIDGNSVRLPLLLRALGRLLRPRVLKKGMKPGVQLRGDIAKRFMPPPMDWEAGLEKIRAAIHRLQTETKREPSAFWGRMTREEWDQLHCRHSELHLSYLAPVDG
jgi:hypothetical protein